VVNAVELINSCDETSLLNPHEFNKDIAWAFTLLLTLMGKYTHLHFSKNTQNNWKNICVYFSDQLSSETTFSKLLVFCFEIIRCYYFGQCSRF
jgi:hypothetical protein